MATESVYSFSWYTLTAVMVAVASHYGARYLLRKRHPKEYEKLRFQGLMESQAESYRLKQPVYMSNPKEHIGKLFSNWMLKFKFFELKDTPYTLYCLFANISSLVALYYVIVEPIYYESISTW